MISTSQSLVNDPSMVATKYQFCSHDESWSGTINVPRTIWEYSTAEFSNDFVVGIPEDPVLDNIIQQLNLHIKPIDIAFWKLDPVSDEDQIKYLGSLLRDMY